MSELQREFRDALGSFATGVTIATTLAADGAPVGVTASSFNSVSLDPPLVLWSLAKNSLSREAFSRSGHFAVHVLAASQRELSDRFARSGADKFDGVDWLRGALGAPVFPEFAARFECRTRHEYEGGDHIILVGEVVEFEARPVAPLLFLAGRYARHQPDSEPGGDEAEETMDILNEALSLERALETVVEGKLGEAELAEARRLMQRIVELARGASS